MTWRAIWDDLTLFVRDTIDEFRAPEHRVLLLLLAASVVLGITLWLLGIEPPLDPPSVEFLS